VNCLFIQEDELEASSALGSIEITSAGDRILVIAVSGIDTDSESDRSSCATNAERKANEVEKSVARSGRENARRFEYPRMKGSSSVC
jgi:hypothetical protein